ncbi:hypothetical protein EDB86DRAFT_153566 [Lactarius hatsudake]|nr:hypothetical protein EDB86DRAFT_153566 [Lactarius hatsudake]
MAGDHKCPVCNATFTRPQHVARHMRSHTGDRPYKCQHCGDQFARSDLLSRHVNKCHPNEKPLLSSAPSRRKGSASASRATTSKQACDQCVQSSLPCDGANPCSKCVHRKARCTYVKFHRQTAPLGPGHPSRPTNDSSSVGLPSLGPLPSGPSPYRLSDPFLLGSNGAGLNPTANISQPPTTNTLYANHQFSFPPPLSASAPAYDNAYEYTARYRAQAELLSRTGVIPQDRVLPLPAIYQDTQPPHDQGTARYAQSYNVRGDPLDYPLPPSPNGIDYGYNVDNKSESYSNDISGYTTNGYDQPLTYNLDTQSHQRCESSTSDTGSTTSRSQPSSATSSSVHLPLPPDYPQSYSRPQTADGVVQDREGFSSAFGLMSLDDPDVLAGLSDGAPFFDNTNNHGSGNSHNPSWGDGPTPRANPCDAPPANGGKGARNQQQQQQGETGNSSATTPASLKELKEIWKQYMRTPLSGQPLAHEHNPGGSPKRERGLSRVASLPSVKTPSATTAGWGDPMRGLNGNQQLQPQHQVAGPGSHHVQQYGGHAAYTRGHNHTDDLRSYEQAVLARRAPLTLHLAPRRRGTTTSTGPHPTDASSVPVSAVLPPTSEKGSSASPVGSGSGSGSDRSASGFTDDRGSTSASPAPGLGGSLAVEDPTRPTFKRLPSQTLGPEYAKRMATASMLSGVRDEFGVGVGTLGEPDLPLLQRRGLVGQGPNHAQGHGHGHGLVMAERARRMSFPSGRTGIVGLQE